MSILKEDVIIEVLSEAHEKAIRERAYEMGYTKGNSKLCVNAWNHSLEYGGIPYCVALEREGKQEFSSLSFYQKIYPNRKKVTLDYLYMEHEDKKTKEIKERIKKCEEELSELRGML